MATPQTAGSKSAEWRRQDEAFEADFYRNWPVLWYATLLGPFVLSAVLLVLIFIIGGPETGWALLGAAAAGFLFFGRFLILGGIAGPEVGFLTPAQLFLLVLYSDIMTACLLTFHIGFLFRMPLVGPRLDTVSREGRSFLKAHPWVRRAAFTVIVLIVLLPVAATGSVSGSILGRLMGMRQLTTFLAVVLGSVLGCSGMWLAAVWLDVHIDPSNPWLTVGGVALLGVIILGMSLGYRYVTRHRGKKAPAT
jgi:hypothetical protein